MASVSTRRPLKILIDAMKIGEGHRDGCYRYTVELIRALRERYGEDPNIGMDLAIGAKPVPIRALDRLIRLNQGRRINIERTAIDRMVLLRQFIADCARRKSPRSLLEVLRRFDQSIGLTRRLEIKHRGRCTIPPGYDVVHLTLPQNCRLMQWGGQPGLITTIHDCTHRRFPQFHTASNARETERGIQFSLDAKASYLAVSDATRRDFVDLYQVPLERVTTTHLAVNHQRCHPIRDARHIEETLRRYGLPNQPYLLALSTLEPRKNLARAIQAFVRLKSSEDLAEVQMVIAGRPGWQYQDIYKQARSDDVRFTGFVADEDLAALYSGAIALVYISYFEGFGLPALEAMACGTPVIYGDCGSLPEIVNDGGLAADPNSTESVMQCLRALIRAPALRRDLGAIALCRASKYSWEATAERTMRAYEQVAESGG